MDVHLRTVVFDCADPHALATFWSQITGFEMDGEPSDGWEELTDPSGRGPKLGFQRVPEGKAVKNRVHLDLDAIDEEAAAREIESLGARRLYVSPDPRDRFVTLADPEGNEFCVVRRSADG